MRDNVNVMVIRAWNERDHLRARVVYTGGDEAGGEKSVLATSSDDILRIVAAWLARIESGWAGDAL
jgi:hypothetical protein